MASLPFPDVTGPAGEALWRARALAVLKGEPLTALESRTRDGIAIAPLAPARRDALPTLRAAPTAPWVTMARVDHPDPETARSFALADLEGGADGLVLVFPGGRAARGYGLPCDTLAALDAALAGVELELITTRLDPAPAGRINALLVAALVRHRKLDPARCRIDFGMDPLATLTHLGTVPWDWATMAARLGETVEALSAMGFPGPFVTVDLRSAAEAGATEAQLVGLALAQGVTYLRALTGAGIAGPEAARAVSFVIPLSQDQFAGIAMLRALRRAWGRVLTLSGLPDRPATIHAETGWRMLSRRDPHVNILRATVAAFAAGVGGADTLTVLPFTAPLGLADSPARRLARNTSLILVSETDVAGIVDPTTGAGGLEALTDGIAVAAWGFFQTIERAGGLVPALSAGLVQSAVAAAGATEAAELAAGKRPLVGTTVFPPENATAPTVLDVPPVQAPIPRARGDAVMLASADVIAALLAGADSVAVAPPPAGRMTAATFVSRRLAEPHEEPS